MTTTLLNLVTTTQTTTATPKPEKPWYDASNRMRIVQRINLLQEANTIYPPDYEKVSITSRSWAWSDQQVKRTLTAWTAQLGLQNLKDYLHALQTSLSTKTLIQHIINPGSKPCTQVECKQALTTIARQNLAILKAIGLKTIKHQDLETIAKRVKGDCHILLILDKNGDLSAKALKMIALDTKYRIMPSIVPYTYNTTPDANGERHLERSITTIREITKGSLQQFPYTKHRIALLTSDGLIEPDLPDIQQPGDKLYQNALSY